MFRLRKITIASRISFVFSALMVMGFLVTTPASASIIKNGSFEINSATGTKYNMPNYEFNATVSDATAFGNHSQIDLMTHGGGFGLNPVDGKWHLGLATRNDMDDAFSFDLNSSIVAGETYDLSFWAARNTFQSSGRNGIKIGISSSATSFGTLTFGTWIDPADKWTLYSTSFVAFVSGCFLTVATPGGPRAWVHVDGFALSQNPVPEPSSIAMWSALGIIGLAVARRKRKLTRTAA